MTKSYEIHSLGFGEDWVEVAFRETRHEAKNVVLIQTMLVKPSWKRDALASLKEDISDLLDEGFRYLRAEANKPKSEDKQQDIPFEEAT